MNPDKIDLIDYAFARGNPAPTSFADLGGVWGVHGAYTFYTLRQYHPRAAFLVDTNLSAPAVRKSRGHRNLTLIQGSFGDEQIAGRIGEVEVIFLFDVLLHQVKPDWNEILQMYSQRTTYFAVFNPQWTASERTLRLLDLGRDEYFRNVPHAPAQPTYKALFEKMYEINPEHSRLWRDIHNVWQWGITDHDLIETMLQLDFKMQDYRNCGQFGFLRNFENHAFVFQKLRNAAHAGP